MHIMQLFSTLKSFGLFCPNSKRKCVNQVVIFMCRYGRTPKPTKPLNYPARDNSLSSSETTPTSQAGSTTSTSKHKPKCTAKKRKPSKSPSVQESKKPKLFTLRASQSEYSDDEENENQWEEEQQPECSSTRDNSAFVPASLRSPHPVIAEVEETVEEVRTLTIISLHRCIPSIHFYFCANFLQTFFFYAWLYIP